MSKGLVRRKTIFDRFSNQLLLLSQHGLLSWRFENKKPYLCPICLREFNESDLEENPKRNHLTLEDAPPEALGGKKVALTCKECNSGCGHEIDNHLTDVIRNIDARYFYKGSKHRGTIEFEGKTLSIELTSEGDGNLTAYHRTKHNNPSLLERFIFGIKNKAVGPILNFKPPKSKSETKRVNYALLKAQYIITFSKFGYIFLLHPKYTNIRRQLRHPDLDIFPFTHFIKDQFQSESVGTYYVHNSGIESVLNVFSLKTEYSNTVIAGLLPIPSIGFREFGRRIDKMKDTQNNVLALNNSRYDPDADLFSDIKEIKKVLNWAK